ncbi:MAG TPA: type II toxin-antitoxin system HicB family antitoxin [Patescibacteria group bacterium]|nr:type II toxin-antitoxin system HicB family antitoxin [Patescibacteria group bacterium]
MANYNFPIIIEKDEDGFYVASTPVIQGCYTQGKTYKEALERIQEAIELHIEARKIKIDFIPQDKLKV